jgi:N-acetylglucosamine kinase-like BadF-type ATPase
VFHRDRAIVRGTRAGVIRGAAGVAFATAMPVVLGVEGGGSHCHALVADGSGAVLGAGANDDCGNWEDVGIEAAAAALRSCAREALDAAGAAPESVDGSVFSLAGVDFPIDEGRLSGIPLALGLAEPTRILNDAFAGLRAGTDRPYGVVVVAGTGSVVAGRNERGEEFRTLGLGPTFGDVGSASEVSESAVTAVALAYVGRGPATLLTQMLCGRTGSESVEQFLEGTARLRYDAASFAPLVVEAANLGDQVACDLLARAGDALGATAVHVIRRLGMRDAEFEVVLAGGLFRAASRHLPDAVERTVRGESAGAEFVPLRHPPVVGAALLALELAGVAPGTEVRERLGTDSATSLFRSGHST